MKVVKTPQSLCRAAIVRCDITPPIGIYHRMWGAALHDRATGVHRLLEARLLWMESSDTTKSKPQVIVALDHCILDAQEIRNIRDQIHQATGVDLESILITMSHTHGAGWMSRTRGDLPGGELLAPYLDDLANKLSVLAVEAQRQLSDCSIVYGIGRCNLATHRDHYDEQQCAYVCGFNPDGKADDTLVIAKLVAASGKSIGVLVNYACHPTTLAWENTLISPDWVGAMRETVEQFTGATCIYLQGASGDLGPREGFVGDTAVADRNGHQVALAGLSAWVAMPEAGTEFRYAGPVVSGTAIGTWKHQPVSDECKKQCRKWFWESLVVELPYRHDLPTLEDTISQRDHWLSEENQARHAGDMARVRDCRAQVEQRTRQINRLNNLVPGRTYPLTIRLGIVGDAIWVFTPGELYQVFQTVLRQRFYPRPVVITTLTNDWQPGYIPPASSYGYNIYQEVIAATAAGCLEILIETVTRRLLVILDTTSAIA